MKTKNLLTTLALCTSLFANAQLQPATVWLSCVNYDAPANHTKEVWSTTGITVLVIDMSRDANGYITNITTSTPPPIIMDQSKTTGSRTGNVYTATTQKNHNGGTYFNAKRETWESDGTHDTCIWWETYDTITSVWTKSQRNVLTYNGSDLESMTGYYWNATTSAWTISSKNVWSFEAGKKDSNNAYFWDSNTSTWKPNGYFKYFYTGNKMDSMQQWSRDNTTGLIYLQYRFAITPDANNKTGSFTQMRWKNNAWENSLTIDYTGGGSSGTKDLKNNGSISFYPNPANEELHVDMNDKNINHVLVKIFSINGKEVSMQTLTDGTSTINTASLKNGLYVLHVENEGLLISEQKLMIER